MNQYLASSSPYIASFTNQFSTGNDQQQADDKQFFFGSFCRHAIRPLFGFVYVISRKLDRLIPHCDKTPIRCGILAASMFLLALIFYRLRTISTLMTLAIHGCEL
jgi:hypothetical protein